MKTNKDIDKYIIWNKQNNSWLFKIDDKIADEDIIKASLYKNIAVAVAINIY